VNTPRTDLVIERVYVEHEVAADRIAALPPMPPTMAPERGFVKLNSLDKN
jgi:hypothetical protein